MHVALKLATLQTLPGDVGPPEGVAEKVGDFLLSPEGGVHYPLETPWRSGTICDEFELVEFIA